MKHKFGMTLAAVLVLGLSACGSLGTVAGNAVAAVGDQFVPASVQAPVANTAAAAENFYTASVKVLTAAANNHALTLGQVNQLDPLESKVYGAIVVVRQDVQQGKDVTAALAVFNAAYGKLFTAANSDGIALSTTGGVP